MDRSGNTRRNNRLRQARIARSWRQRDLAEQLGTTELTVKRWERGYQQPSTYFQVKLCTLFGKSAEELGLVEDTSAPIVEKNIQDMEQATSPAQSQMLWTVPYLRNSHFTGRDDLLEQLARHLSREKPGDATTPRRALLSQPQAIKGLGGIGKTQIAVEYAYRSREHGDHTHILWINAASEEVIITSFQTLAQLLPDFADKDEKNQHELIAAIKRWLERCQESWLLIFDNADDLALVQPYIPQQGQGSILLTTRATAVGWLANSVEVEQMGLMEGTQFLLHRAQRLQASEEEYNEATNVVIALDGFPLALDQAGAYIEETGCSFNDYLQLYEHHRITLLARRGKQAANYPHSVATTWSLSFQTIEQANPAAADLLRLCAFLAPDHIPEELLKEGAPHWPLILQEAVCDLFAFHQMLEELLKFSLIKRLVEEHMLSIHRLVQAVQRERMDPEEQQHWATRAISAVNTVFPPDPKNEEATWSRCQRYLEQVQGCDLLIQQYGLSFSEAADVLHRAGNYLCEHALYALAEPLYQRALCIWEQQLGPQHPQIGSGLTSLGHLYSRQGKYTKAEAFDLRALHIWEQQLGPHHPKVAHALNNLANTYKEQGKYAKAESCYLRALHIWEQALGSEHLQVSDALNGLANVYLELGKYAEAEPLYLRAIHIWEQQQRPEAMGVTYPLTGLGALYGEQGKYLEAEPLFQRVRHILEQQFGPQHPQVAYPLHNLAELYIELGDYAEAAAFNLRALDIWEQQLGPQHPMVSYALNNLAILCVKRGQYAEAEAHYLRALHIREQVLGSEHPQVANTLNGLANLYCEQGKYEQAESCYQRSLSILEQQALSSHPEAAKVMHDFARFQEVQRKTEEARIWYERAFTIREVLLGSHHPKTKETRTCLIALPKTTSPQ
ncbi:tetratricopeptide repeat protein [Reticulibacter mediterranei]|uniref:Tetratricopeptide repeat protein n=1 Tax=Reticulibacter mediterranei TaxID=2778369 RepID=A0A8J3IEI8_9CHLR|nr:FxSxx-COOH system tetratricopeptide repeat protein [Reticulibacter mediterranei]GHO90147.1 tetratricopeptide repeat protein [Reticulibacter mediterranei]